MCVSFYYVHQLDFNYHLKCFRLVSHFLEFVQNTILSAKRTFPGGEFKYYISDHESLH